MKKLIALVVLFLGLKMTAFAQPQYIRLDNQRDCPVQVRLCGNCLGGSPCDFCVLINVPPITTLTFADVTQAVAGSVTPGMGLPSCPPIDFYWHLADVQNNDCCDGAGITVGDGTCPYTSSPCFVVDRTNVACPGKVFCVSWTPSNTPPGIDVVIY